MWRVVAGFTRRRGRRWSEKLWRTRRSTTSRFWPLSRQTSTCRSTANRPRLRPAQHGVPPPLVITPRSTRWTSRALHCLSRNAVRSLQFCLNNLDLEFFETVRSSSCSAITCDDAMVLPPLCGVCFAMQLECRCHLSNETVSCRYTDSGMSGLHPLRVLN